MSVHHAADKTVLLEKRLELGLKRLISALKIRNSAAEVVLLPPEKMRLLKKKFLKKKIGQGESVDVLAFEEPPFFPHPDKKGNFLGEICVNREIALKDVELAKFLLVHGLLHLLHYSHDKKSDILKMEKLEKRLIKKLKPLK